ncbi:hypothetical protein K458DRAFT_384667 [Lentithecium fluviatile CBS 122367]|uniref:Uncharacterized protein n=1 Tax=Lentithecium fluviatile CBS 122367 TaxID=1168545 RepID=A0A6G1JD69_9PLEO|nr:hypothetical protein K458DRAFT_384667 [Lentithecium fluviatile CBS 122367]
MNIRALSHPSGPKRLHPINKEPMGWDFSRIDLGAEIPSVYWFFPWANTEFLWPSTPLPPTPSKLFYAEVGKLKMEYRGTGIVLDERAGRVVGCYKAHADSGEPAHETNTALARLEGNATFAKTEISRILQFPATRRTNADQDLVSKLHAGLAAMSKEKRRLQGLLLDPRPQYIAFHKEEVLKVHPGIKISDYKMFGDRYLALEGRIRRAMGEVFDEEKDLPPWRKEDEVERRVLGEVLREMLEEISQEEGVWGS